MKEYAVTVFAVCIFGGALSMISHRRFGSAQSFLWGAVILYALLSPAVELVRDFDVDSIFSEFNTPVELPEYSYESVAAEAFEGGIIMAVAEEFDLDSKDIRVRVSEFDFEKMRAEEIRITLSGLAALADWRAIEGYVNKMNVGECKVEIEIG